MVALAICSNILNMYMYKGDITIGLTLTSDNSKYVFQFG